MKPRHTALLAALGIALACAGCGRAIDPSDPSEDPSSALPPPPWPVCAAQTGEARVAPSRGVDIVLSVDTSSSMTVEAGWVKDNLNAFARYIADQDIDYRVVVVAERGDTRPIAKLPSGGVGGEVVTSSNRRGICVPAPLGGPNCGDGPRFRHVDRRVDGDALKHLVAGYQDYRSFLRADASTSFVAISDDDSSKPPAWFEQQIAALGDPGFPDGYTFHSIVGVGADPLRGCATAARAGRVYQELSRKTGGSVFPVCRTDWRPTFEALAREVVKASKPPCAYRLPVPPDGKSIQPRQIRVSYLADGQPELLQRVESAAGCAAVAGGARAFFTDDANNPRFVRFCPGTCAALDGGTIRVSYGCLTID
ncbi:MAG: hypothetical protein KC503_07640 [Myxococcales bacterium]|nr:hypothetical protein [Myxococcales bacterium]